MKITISYPWDPAQRVRCLFREESQGILMAFEQVGRYVNCLSKRSRRFKLPTSHAHFVYTREMMMHYGLTQVNIGSISQNADCCTVKTSYLEPRIEQKNVLHFMIDLCL